MRLICPIFVSAYAHGNQHPYSRMEDYTLVGLLKAYNGEN